MVSKLSVGVIAKEISQAVGIWTLGEHYSPGDIVFAEVPGVLNRTKYQCRQSPFGDFCAHSDPTTQEGVQAWRTYTQDLGELPEPSKTLVKCVSEISLHF